MTWVDAAIAIIFLFFIITAFQAGFIREIIGMSSALLGAVLAGLFYSDVADTLLVSIDNNTTASVIAFLIIFVGICWRCSSTPPSRSCNSASWTSCSAPCSAP
jgi:uncharacterized membrane protein required for colicin V production